MQWWVRLPADGSAPHTADVGAQYIDRGPRQCVVTEEDEEKEDKEDSE